MYKNVIVIVINYIANVIEFYNYFIITQLLQIFKSYKFHIFPALSTAGMGKWRPAGHIRCSYCFNQALSQPLAILKISLVS